MTLSRDLWRAGASCPRQPLQIFALSWLAWELPAYIVAARIPIHPSRFSSILRERESLPVSLAERIREVIREEQQFRSPAG